MQQNFDATFIDNLIQFRRNLHQRPELSGEEKFTPGLILDFLAKRNDKRTIRHLGGNGLAIVYDSGNPGPVTVFRAELDALPIQEVNEMAYKSETNGVSHKCGHDGHMAIVAGLGKLLHDEPPTKGKVVLLFQPAEETGEGANAVLNDERFTALAPDFFYALHNLPLLEKGAVFIKSGTFSAASRGIIITMKGATSHAAEPENGRSPALALSDIIKFISLLPKQPIFKNFALTTVVHALLGEPAFGISPGHGEIRATLRTYLNEDMECLTKEIETYVTTICQKEKLEVTIGYTEIFPETSNSEVAANVVRESARKANIACKELDQPFKWSEDFGHFLLKYKGALFALGAGADIPKLHNHDYDFPDELIPIGLAMFKNIVNHHNF